MKKPLSFLKAGLEFVFIVSLGAFLGYNIDHLLLRSQSLRPAGLIIGTIGGMILGFLFLWRLLQNLRT